MDDDHKKAKKATATNPQQPAPSPPPESAVSQLNQLKPIPGIDTSTEDVTQRPLGPTDNPETNKSVMKDVEPKSQQQSQMGGVRSQMDAAPNGNNSQMGSLMGNNSTLGSVIRPVDFNQTPQQQEASDTETVFVETKAVSRPAIVKEPKKWLKRQNIDMTRNLPIGIQPGDVDAKKMNMHSHTGVPSRLNAKTAVSAAPASSPTPIQHAVSSGESVDKSAENAAAKKKAPATSHQPRLKKSAQRYGGAKPAGSPVYAKSCPTSPSFGLPTSHTKEKESAFAKFAKAFLPSSPGPPTAVEAKTKRSKSTNTIHERKRSNKHNNKKDSN